MSRSVYAKAALSVGVFWFTTAMIAQQPYNPYGNSSAPQYGQYGNSYQNDPGYRHGFEDGMQSGERDFQTGKRGDPTKSQKYGDTPGYNSSYGEKEQWKQQYRQGYIAGYQRASSGGANERYGQGPGGQAGYGQRPYGQGGYGQSQFSQDPGYRRGFEDGMRSGQKDVQTGKRGDPVKSENYEDTPGYNSSYGDKGQWKQQYRQGYTAGYERARNEGWNGQNGNVGAGNRYPYDGRSGNGGYRGQTANDPAYQHGYQDGMTDGQRDVQRNKRNADITKSQHYGDTPGYDSSYGSKDQWKAAYRQGYENGYQQAWQGDMRR